MLYYVDALISQSDDVLEQIEILKRNIENKEVQYYLNCLEIMEISPYLRWLLDKYLYGKEVGEAPAKPNYQVKLLRVYSDEYDENREIYPLTFRMKAGDEIFYQPYPLVYFTATLLYIEKDKAIIKTIEFSKTVIQEIPISQIIGIMNSNE